MLLSALAGAFLAQRLGQPLMVGYILAGVVVLTYSNVPAPDILRVASIIRRERYGLAGGGPDQEAPSGERPLA